MNELLKHRYIVWAIGTIVLIAVVSTAYYVFESRKPVAVLLPVSATGGASIIASGAVEPIENPDLSFEVGGRIVSVPVHVGDHVYAGQVLATLDVAALVAARASAQAGVSGAQAHLDSLKAGARDTDSAVKRAQVAQAVQARSASYAGTPSALSDAFAKASDAVHVQADTLFSNPNTASPSLIFNTTDANAGSAAIAARLAAGAELQTWGAELSLLSAASTQPELDQALAHAVAHLGVIRSFEDKVTAALAVAIPTAAFPSGSVSTAQASISVARANVNGSITSITALQQNIISQGLAIDAANTSLNQLLAGASPQDIQVAQAALDSATASVRSLDAQIGENLIIARFPGMVASVSVKAGELASPNVTAITILPDSSLEINVYVTEIDVTRLKIGNTADVTLDAYGSNRLFPAHVSAVDQAPSTHNGVSAYKVTLSFDSPSAAIKTGMTANATIHPN